MEQTTQNDPSPPTPVDRHVGVSTLQLVDTIAQVHCAVCRRHLVEFVCSRLVRDAMHVDVGEPCSIHAVPAVPA